MSRDVRHIGVLLPLPLDKAYSYAVPHDMEERVHFGVRVEVQFGKSKHYAGLVVEESVAVDSRIPVKPILSVLDTVPLITPQQYQFWRWMAAYYGCNLGEVMSAALPTHLKLSSETHILAGPRFEEVFPSLQDEEYLLAEALTIQEVLQLEDVRQILQRKTVYPLLLNLLHQQVITFQEELQDKFKPKQIGVILPGPKLEEKSPQALEAIFEALKNAPQQENALLGYLQLSKGKPYVRKSDLRKLTDTADAAIAALVKKGILKTATRVVSRLEGPIEDDGTQWSLSAHQQDALKLITEAFKSKQTVLLQGITGSGKTLLYAQLILSTLEAGRQVLFLLPEIALTNQLLIRLQRLTGKEVLTYHSRLNPHERVEIWQRVMTDPTAFVVGPRSALFLPWFNPGLIIVDEEHDSSYKQHDPAPRYQGRDAALYLAHLFKARALLGTATPSLESWYNARRGKYGWVKLTERYGGAQLPEMKLVDLRQEAIKGAQGLFSGALLKHMGETLARKEQIILFQNRRGFAPALHCELCQWNMDCAQCDVTLTYHKPGNKMICHYCGYQTDIPISCPKCGNKKLRLKGFGTQRIEDDLKIFFPEARIDRLDLDTARSRQNLLRILDDFAERKIDILVGTQMVTKGLDFENLGLVGVVMADQLLAYPDFRSAERAFQLMTQVAGRAGRRKGQSLVIIQTRDPEHPVMQDVLHQRLEDFYQRELQERQAYFYPPFSKVMRVLIKHKVEEKAAWAADQLAGHLRTIHPEHVMGPTTPTVTRIAGYHLRTIQIKSDPNSDERALMKQAIHSGTASMRAVRGMSGLIIQMDVDPM
jgi:primosomal protein N' (replication factor Y)